MFLSGYLNYDITYSRVEKVSDYGLIDQQTAEYEFNPKEFALIKIQVKDEEKTELLRIVEATSAKIIDITDKIYTIQSIGDEKQIQALIELVRPFSIKEFVRSGKVAISRSSQFSNLKNL